MYYLVNYILIFYTKNNLFTINSLFLNYIFKSVTFNIYIYVYYYRTFNYNA